MNKILAIIPMLALSFAISASSASAYQNFDFHGHQFPKLNIENLNEAFTTNEISSHAFSGNNIIAKTFGFDFSDPVITTGNATAMSDASTRANSNDIGASASDKIETFVKNGNKSDAINRVYSFSDSGNNRIYKTFGSTLTSITSGDAMSGSSALTLVNSNIIRLSK